MEATIPTYFILSGMFFTLMQLGALLIIFWCGLLLIAWAVRNFWCAINQHIKRGTQ